MGQIFRSLYSLVPSKYVFAIHKFYIKVVGSKNNNHHHIPLVTAANLTNAF